MRQKPQKCYEYRLEIAAFPSRIMAAIGCGRQRHDSTVNRVEKLKSQRKLHRKIRAEGNVALEVKPKNPAVSEQGKKIANFFKSSQHNALRNNICSLVIFALTKFGNQRIMYI
jgi:hypothetical protein